MMSTEHNYTKGSRQYAWLEQDLQKVNREKTPWVVIGGHRAMYTSQKIWRKYFELFLCLFDISVWFID